MSYMISSSTNYHWVRRIEAETNTIGVLKITLWGEEVTDEQHNMAEILIFTEDPQMVDRMVSAINFAAEEPADAE